MEAEDQAELVSAYHMRVQVLEGELREAKEALTLAIRANGGLTVRIQELQELEAQLAAARNVNADIAGVSNVWKKRAEEAEAKAARLEARYGPKGPRIALEARIHELERAIDEKDDIIGDFEADSGRKLGRIKELEAALRPFRDRWHPREAVLHNREMAHRDKCGVCATCKVRRVLAEEAL